ncbi:DUF7860 family protein [Halorussus halobius]|uniref:DUF7860 family protein n=1 Tax=Halorussus halobius TaxID=1710537 RepID=UPI00109267AC|nr:hypothetical protein [Halorussus halobius]
MGRYGDLDYQYWAKTGFLLSVAVFAAGAGAELSVAATNLTLSGWEQTLFVDMEIVGVLGALFSPLLFGIVLPLTE